MKARDKKGACIVHYDANGNTEFLSTGDVQFFVVDERSPHDRVYEITTEISSEDFDAILGLDEAGSQNDTRHSAVVARIDAYLDGRPHLEPVA